MPAIFRVTNNKKNDAKRKYRSSAIPKVSPSDLNIYFWQEAREHIERLSL